jgi:pimeloyl-ACP methyl ester carboxylesterase
MHTSIKGGLMMAYVDRFKRWVLLTTVMMLLCQAGLVNAAQDSQGKDFWIAFMQNYNNTSTLQLFITSSVNTKGTVEIPGLSWSTSFTVAADVTTTVNIPNNALLYGTGIQNKGIHVVANDEVTVYGLNRIQATTDAFLALPVDALNLQYYVLAYANTIVHSSDAEEFALVAAFDNTTIQFTIPGSSPQQITLNKGQAYQYSRPGADGHLLTGTYVQSDKPIAVFGGNACTNIPWYMNVFACDHVVEQIPPLAAWGKQFYTVPLATRLNGDTFVVLAGADGTGVDINGERKANLNAGQLYEQIIQGRSVISTSAPALVAQYSNSSSYDGVTSDPFMMIVPPVEQSLSHYTFSTPGSGFQVNYVNVVAPTAAVGSIKLDGTTVNQQLFSPIPGTSFSGGQVPLSVGSHTMDAPQRFGIHSYGYASYDSYGYPGGMAFEIINPGVIDLTPATMLVGTFDANNLPAVNEIRTFRLLNEGNTTVTINSIALEGNDYSDYSIVSVNGVPVNNTSFTWPFKLWPQASMEIKVALIPQHTPADSTFDAVLTVNGHDDNGYVISSVGTLVANLNSTSLAVDILDASPTIAKIDSNGVPVPSSGGPRLDENMLSSIDAKGSQKRVGLVADGNARLFLRAKTNKTSGFVTFNIKQPSDSEARISGINFSSNDDSLMHTAVIVPIVPVNGGGQATAILRAAERFIAGDTKSDANIDIEACYQETQTGSCLANDEFRVKEVKAPVVLIHGLWADAGSWQSGNTKKPGVLEGLISAYYSVVGNFEYNGDLGPSELMTSNESSMANLIRTGSGSDGLCDQLTSIGFACTRADMVVHSMGGLVARKFLYDNSHYKSKLNFGMGSVRRIVTIGTPHLGSQLASLLLRHNNGVNNCIRDDNPQVAGIQNGDIDNAIWVLDKAGKHVASAITDLEPDSSILNSINASKQNISIFALYGNSGTDFDFGGAAPNFVLKKLISEGGCTYDDVFGSGMHSDGIVPVTSASASGKQFPQSDTQELAGVVHVGMGTNQLVVGTVVPLLSKPLSQFANGI